MHPWSVHLHRPQLIDSRAAIHWTRAICPQPLRDPARSRRGGGGEAEERAARRLNKPFVFLARGVSACSCVHSGDREGRWKKKEEIGRDGEMFLSMAAIAAVLTGRGREAAEQEGGRTEPDSEVAP